MWLLENLKLNMWLISVAHIIFLPDNIVADAFSNLLDKVSKLGEVEDPGSRRGQFQKHGDPKKPNFHHMGLSPECTS